MHSELFGDPECVAVHGDSVWGSCVAVKEELWAIDLWVRSLVRSRG